MTAPAPIRPSDDPPDALDAYLLTLQLARPGEVSAVPLPTLIRWLPAVVATSFTPAELVATWAEQKHSWRWN